MVSLAERGHNGHFEAGNANQEVSPRGIQAHELPVPSPESEVLKKSYLESIGRSDLEDVITPNSPVGIFAMECYRHDMPAQGGLGMVVGDWSYLYRKTGLPTDIYVPFYNVEVHQELEDLKQVERRVPVKPEERGFAEIEDIDVRLSSGTYQDFKVPIYAKVEDNVRIIAPYHSDIQDVYNGKTNSDHRLFQEVIAGFGGHQAMEKLGVKPPVFIMNEAPVVFAPIAELDSLVSEGMDFETALKQVREKTVYVNHTLVQAVEEPFNRNQFLEQVYPNIKNINVIEWVDQMFADGEIKLSTLALAISDKRRGVSRLHAQEASKMFTDFDGNRVDFEAITNGISAQRWAHPKLFDLLEDRGVLDEFENPSDNTIDRIMALPTSELRQIKDAAQAEFREALKGMRDQNGNPIDLPEGVKIIGSARRAAKYKRMDLPFTDPDRLAAILLDNDAHFFISGKAHVEDHNMKDKIREVCQIINSHPVLSERVHYIQDYNEEVSRPLIRASDIWLNNPMVRDEKTWEPTSTEADGTSKDKATLNNAIIVSTEDGGMKDPAIIETKGGVVIPGRRAPYYLRIDSDTRDGEIESLYTQLERGLQIVEGNDEQYTWGTFVKRQLASNIEIISGGRWIKDELNFAFPGAKKNRRPDLEIETELIELTHDQQFPLRPQAY